MIARTPAYQAEEIGAETRLSQAAARWRRRSRLIGFWRRALPFLIGAVVAIVIGMVGWQSWRNAQGRRADPDAATARMVNPRFYGRDDQGRPFVLAAESATRDPENATRIILVKPQLTLGGEAERPVRVTARQGLFTEADQVVRLEGDVVMRREGEYEFRTGLAVIDGRTNLVSGRSPVEGTAPLGRISASAYAVHDRGERIVFSGGVSARLVNE